MEDFSLVVALELFAGASVLCSSLVSLLHPLADTVQYCRNPRCRFCLSTGILFSYSGMFLVGVEARESSGKVVSGVGFLSIA